MALVLKDRVKETTTTTGTGTVTLAGAVTGFQSFSVIGNANTTYYVIAGQNTNEWEVGIGTYTASGTTLSRDTVLESSNSGSLVNFSAGVKDVFVTYPAERAVYTDGAGTAITPATASALAITSGGTGATSAPNARTNLGATTVGGNLFTLTNPSAITFPRFNADNTVSALSAADFRTAIGAGTGSGDVVGPSSSTDNAIARFDGTTGKLIQNSAVTIDDTTGSMTFTGSSARISGTFGGTATTDTLFQTATLNGNTNLGTLPNGTSTQSGIVFWNNSTITNGGYFATYITSSASILESSRNGVGTYLPLRFSVGGSTRQTITANGGIAFGSSPTAYGTSGQVLQSNGDAPPTWVTPSSGSGTSIGLARAIAINCILP